MLASFALVGGGERQITVTGTEGGTAQVMCHLEIRFSSSSDGRHSGSDLKLDDRDVDNIFSRDRTYQPSVSPTFSLSASSTLTNVFSTRYVVSLQDRTLPDDDAAEGNTSHVSLGRPTEVDDDVQNAQTQGGKPQMSGAQRKKQAREEKKKRRGQNKGRRFQKVRDELDLCWKVAADETCEFGSECV